MRSTTDGSVVHFASVGPDDAEGLLRAGLALAVHPSGRYMAYPDGPAIRLRALVPSG